MGLERIWAVLIAHWWRKNLGLFVDWVIIVATMVYVIALVSKDSYNDHPEFLFASVFIIPAANAVWLNIRLTPRIPALAFRPHREELALTFIPAHDYLVRQLRWPLIRALAPTCITWLILAVYGIEAMGDPGMVVIIGVICTSIYVTGLAFSTAGTFDLLVRSCRRPSQSSTSYFIIPSAWIALAGVAAAANVSPIYVDIYTPYLPDESSWVFYIVSLAFVLFLITITFILFWKAITHFMNRKGFLHCFLIPLIWSFFIFTPIALLYFAVYTQKLNLGNIKEGRTLFVMLGYTLSPILSSVALIIAIKRWRQAVEVYYQFE